MSKRSCEAMKGNENKKPIGLKDFRTCKEKIKENFTLSKNEISGKQTKFLCRRFQKIYNGNLIKNLIT